MSKLKNKFCTGCGACYNICQKNAITMTENEKGFLVPIIDQNNCINCNSCIRVCPLNNYKNNNTTNPDVFSMVNNNEEIRLKSSSGGIFYLLAKTIINQGGIVFGCIWDEKNQPKHVSACSIEDILKMQGSKYVQSDTKKTYIEVKEYLKIGKKVLYVGTPCQIAGLKSFLSKDYEQLYSVDLICHGVPSRKIFDMFKKEFCESHNISENITNINMRSKITDWGKPFTMILSTENKEYIIPFENNNFLESFLHNYNINDSCTDCKFNILPRSGDVTLGDFCGVDEFDKSLNDKKGISVLLINSDKGKAMFNDIKENCSCRDIPLKDAAQYNRNILCSTKENAFRDKFFNCIMSGKSLHDSMKNSRNTYPKLLKIFYNLQPDFIKNIIKRFL